jgi:hypothetical protein
MKTPLIDYSRFINFTHFIQFANNYNLLQLGIVQFTFLYCYIQLCVVICIKVQLI